ncbi:hypothetical protein ORF004 [Yersinia phage PYps16T]|uniref:Uncharacterized protein n=1 Tax=Yersinia phage PYps23T TaxID=2801356 RepID=A0AAE7TQR1_9CAUD|nr:hypothetical protein QNG99_gp04 [Yersinia phage PYps23T]QQO90923.1 hypothetical protein ORF004 [Yersinia phage PYps23T]QQO91091.1 hypothetical protein ORF004 [Yersinia phage PYps4T]QQO91261.1 hypothetical protein ORF004 [Yersinia phage PYps16T]
MWRSCITLIHLKVVGSYILICVCCSRLLPSIAKLLHSRKPHLLHRPYVTQQVPKTTMISLET